MKVYFYSQKSNYDKLLLDKNKSQWLYCGKKQVGIKKINSVGMINVNSGEVLGNLVKDEQQIPIYRVRKTLLYSTVGYMVAKDDSGDEVYLEVKKNRFRSLASIFMILLIMFAVIKINFLNNGIKFEDSAIAYQMPDGVKNEDPDSIMIPGYQELRMKEGNWLNSALINPEGNTCYFKYTLLLTDLDNVIYESDWIKPGNAVVPVYLNQELSAGDYNVKILVSTLSMEEPSLELNGGEIVTTLIVK